MNDELLRAKVIVPDNACADEANRLYGEAYGVDWEYESSAKRDESAADPLRALVEKWLHIAGRKPKESKWHHEFNDGRASAFQDCADELAATLSQANGWVLVPREPTPEMLRPIAHRGFQDNWDAGKKLQREQLARSSAAGHYGYQDWMIPPKTEYEVAAGQYLAMLAAAPAAQGAKDEKDYRDREHVFPAHGKLGTAFKFLTTYNRTGDDSWGWEAEYSQGKDYGYYSRGDAIVAAVKAAVAADPRPCDVGDLQHAVRQYTASIIRGCVDDSEAYASIAWMARMSAISERLGTPAAAPAVVVDDLREVFQLCHHPAYPDPLRLQAETLDAALREIAPHYRDGIVLLRTVTGGRTTYTGEQLRQMAAAALGQGVGRG